MSDFGEKIMIKFRQSFTEFIENKMITIFYTNGNCDYIYKSKIVMFIAFYICFYLFKKLLSCICRHIQISLNPSLR